MTTAAKSRQRASRNKMRTLQAACLVMLAERIVCSSDRKALRELHNHRTPFRLRVDRPMTFVEFVTALSETPWALRLYGCDRSALELAQDRMIDQFSLLPDNRTEETHRGDVAGFSEAYARFRALALVTGSCVRPRVDPVLSARSGS